MSDARPARRDRDRLVLPLPSESSQSRPVIDARALNERRRHVPFKMIPVVGVAEVTNEGIYIAIR